MTAPARSRAQRRRDTEHRLAHDVDVWVAGASHDGIPYLVPLSFHWDGEALLVATPAGSPTGRNLAATRAARLALGHTRDVSMIDAEVEVLEIDALSRDQADSFVARTGFDPRPLDPPYRWYRLFPSRIQAWREVNELPSRDLMHGGRWMESPPRRRAPDADDDPGVTPPVANGQQPAPRAEHHSPGFPDDATEGLPGDDPPA